MNGLKCKETDNEHTIRKHKKTQEDTGIRMANDSTKNNSYPNQKIICTHKPKLENDFLMIGNGDVKDAGKNIKTYTAFRVYLYLAGNNDGYNLRLSRKNVTEELGISKDSYIRAIKELTDSGYVVHRKGNIYDFYVNPMYAPTHTLNNDSCMHASIHNVCTEAYSMYAPTHTEIDNLDNLDNLSKRETHSKESADKERIENAELRKRYRTLEDLDDSELDGIIEDYKSKVRYADIYKKYNLERGVLSKNVLDDISVIKKSRKKDDDANRVSSSLGLTSSECYELAKYFGTTIDGVPVCMDIIKDNVDVDAASSLAASDLLGLLRYGDYNLDVANPDFSVIARDWQSRCVDAVVDAEADVEADVG